MNSSNTLHLPPLEEVTYAGEPFMDQYEYHTHGYENGTTSGPGGTENGSNQGNNVDFKPSPSSMSSFQDSNPIQNRYETPESLEFSPRFKEGNMATSSPLFSSSSSFPSLSNTSNSRPSSNSAPNFGSNSHHNPDEPPVMNLQFINGGFPSGYPLYHKIPPNNNMMMNQPLNMNQNTNNILSSSGSNILSSGNNILTSSGNNILSSGGNNILSSGGNNILTSSGNNILNSSGNNILTSSGNSLTFTLKGNNSFPNPQNLPHNDFQTLNQIHIKPHPQESLTHSPGLSGGLLIPSASVGPSPPMPPSSSDSFFLSNEANTSLIRGELEIQLFHKPRGLKGMWQKIEPEDSIRVTKDKGKHIKVQISAPPQVQEIDINGNRFDVFLVHSDNNVETRDGFWIEPCKSKICQNRVELEVKLLKIAKNIHYGVRIECGNLLLTGRSVRFSTHDNGKQRASRSPNRSPNRSPIRSPNRSPRSPSGSRARAASSPYPVAPPGYTKFEKHDLPSSPLENSSFREGQIAGVRTRPTPDFHFRTNIEELNEALDFIQKNEQQIFEWDSRSSQHFTGAKKVISLLGYELFRTTNGLVFRDDETESYSVNLQHILPLLHDCYKQFLYGTSTISLPSPSNIPHSPSTEDINLLRARFDSIHFQPAPSGANNRSPSTHSNRSASLSGSSGHVSSTSRHSAGPSLNNSGSSIPISIGLMNQRIKEEDRSFGPTQTTTTGGPVARRTSEEQDLGMVAIYQQASERSSKIVIAIDWLKNYISDVSFMLVCREHLTTSQTCAEFSTRRSKILFLSSSDDYSGSYQLGVNLKGASLDQLHRADPSIRVFDFRQGPNLSSETIGCHEVKGEGDKWLVGSLMVTPTNLEFRSIYNLLVDTIPREFIGDQPRVTDRRFSPTPPTASPPTYHPQPSVSRPIPQPNNPLSFPTTNSPSYHLGPHAYPLHTSLQSAPQQQHQQHQQHQQPQQPQQQLSVQHTELSQHSYVQGSSQFNPSLPVQVPYHQNVPQPSSGSPGVPPHSQHQYHQFQPSFPSPYDPQLHYQVMPPNSSPQSFVGHNQLQSQPIPQHPTQQHSPNPPLPFPSTYPYPSQNPNPNYYSSELQPQSFTH